MLKDGSRWMLHMREFPRNGLLMAMRQTDSGQRLTRHVVGDWGAPNVEFHRGRVIKRVWACNSPSHTDDRNISRSSAASVPVEHSRIRAVVRFGAQAEGSGGSEASPSASRAVRSPMAGANLKPCPEQGEHMTIGPCRSRMK